MSVTYIDLNHDYTKELNPVLTSNKNINLAIRAGLTLPQYYSLPKINKNRPKLAKTILIMQIGFDFYNSYQDTKTLRKLNRR